MREYQILMELTKNEYLSINQLAELTGVTPRTVRNDLKELSQKPEVYGIEKSSKLGYHLIVVDNTKFKDYLKQFEGNKIEMQKGRLDSLLILLLIDMGYQTITQLSQALLVSPSQIKKDLSNLETYLKDSSLQIQRKAHYGIRIIGTLKNRILLLLNYYQKGNQKLKERIDAIFFEDDRKRFQNKLHKLISIKEWEIDYTELRLLEQELLILLLIKGDSDHYCNKASLLSELLLGERFEVPNYKEIHDYFEMSILSKAKKLKFYNKDTDLKQKINDFFIELDIKQKTIFSSDQEFLQMIYLHVAALIERSNQELTFNNPYLKEISEEYPVIFNYALIFAKWLEDTFDLSISTGEVGYLATHMTVPYHKNQQRLIDNIFRIAVVCSSGGGMAYLVEIKLKRIFPRAKIQTFSMFEIEKIETFYPDLVFSIIELTLNLRCPIILISEIQSELDYLEISQNLNLLKQEETFNVEKAFFDLFDKSFFSIKKRGNYFEYLESQASKMEESISYIGYKDSLMEREKYLSTIYRNGVAIPHPLNMKGKENKISVCLLPMGATGIEKPPKVIFMISLQANQLDLHQLISKELGKLMNHPNAVDILSKSQNFKEFYYTLKKVLGRREANEH